MGNVLGCDWHVRGLRVSCGVADQLASSLLPICLTSDLFLFLKKRLPFYWEIKTVFLLFMSLPQIQVHLSSFSFVDHITHTTRPKGSTYVYTTYLQPFLLQNETDLDAGIVGIQRNIPFFERSEF